MARTSVIISRPPGRSTRTASVIAFCRTGDWEMVLRLKSPVEEHLVNPVFSAQGRWLAAFGARGEIYLWDVPALRRSLAGMGLDWK